MSRQKNWPQIDTVKSWMISSETATFMKWGGLGMVASELPEAFNNCFGQNGDVLTVVTPMYLGDTGKKKAELNGNVYCGAEHRSCEVKKSRRLRFRFWANVRFWLNTRLTFIPELITERRTSF